MDLTVSLRLISLMKLMKCRQRSCKFFTIARLNDKGDSENLVKLPILVEFKDVFPKEFPGIPPKGEIDFTINIKLGMEPIAKAPYHMSTPELK